MCCCLPNLLFVHLFARPRFTGIVCFLLLVPAFSFSQASAAPPIKLAGNKSGDTALVNTWNQQATAVMLFDLDSALLLANRAKNLSTQIDFIKGRADALVALSAIYQNKGNYTQAIVNSLEALKLYEQLHDLSAQGATYFLLSMVYKDMSGNEKASVYNRIALDYSRNAYYLYGQIADTAGIVNSLSLTGTLNRDKAIIQNDNRYYDTAFIAFSTAIDLMKRSGKGMQYISKLYNNISQVYIEQRKDYPTALRYLFDAVAVNRKKNNTVSLSHNYGNISVAYISLKKYDSALFFARKMKEAALHTERPSRILAALFQLSKAYEASGRTDSALHYYIKASNLNDSVNNLAKTRQVTELQTQYETEKKEAEIRILNAENRVKSNRIVWLISGLIVFAALAVCLVALYRRVQRQKLQLAAQATRLEVMMKELHHRVKNNLQIVSSLLNMQTYKLQDAESISALKTSGERVQAMSLIHQRLYKKDELTAVNLKEYVTDLAESLMQSYGYSPANFELRIHVQQELMDVDTALPIGLIVNELITNALKYAYTHVPHPVLEVSLVSQGANIRLSVKDNGVGFNEAEWQLKKGSFGKQLIVSLCRQLRAKQTIHTGDGTEFIISIPQKAA